MTVADLIRELLRIAYRGAANYDVLLGGGEPLGTVTVAADATVVSLDSAEIQTRPTAEERCRCGACVLVAGDWQVIEPYDLSWCPDCGDQLLPDGTKRPAEEQSGEEGGQ